jgi:hypothetical protein
VSITSERVVRSTRFGRAFGKNVIIFGRSALSERGLRGGPNLIGHFMHTIRGPKTGTGTSSGHGAALMIASWWHKWQVTASG